MDNVQKPSMGRMVIYKHAGSADGKYPPIESPAIIQRVCTENPGRPEGELVVDLFVMSNTGGIFFAKSVLHGDAPSSWHWPERV